jgi:hypothetical protein
MKKGRDEVRQSDEKRGNKREPEKRLQEPRLRRFSFRLAAGMFFVVMFH